MTKTTHNRSRSPRRRFRAPRAAALVGVLALAAGLCGAADVETPSAPPTPEAQPQGILLNFQDAPVMSVLEHLSEAGGLTIVEEAAVEGRVTVMSRQPLSLPEAVSLLNTVLAEEGYAAVRRGRVLKIMTLEEAKKASIPVHSGMDPDAIEPNDDVRTQIIPLKFADATQVRDDLAPLIPEYADLSANASSNALILTDTGANVRRIVEIVRALDTHMATVAEVRVFPLSYADATEAADLINEVFQVEQADAGQGGGGFRRAFFGRGGRGGEESEETASRAPQVIASADERTNTVVVSGPGDTLNVVADVIHSLDANPVEEESVLVYRLKNAQAANVAELLNNLFEQSDTTTTARRGGDQEERGGRGSFLARLAQASATAQTAAGLAGDVYCVADEDTNALLILTDPANFDRLKAIIADLDRPIPQVLIKVLIAEVTWSDSVDIGAQFSVLDAETDGEDFSFGTDFDLSGETGGLIYRTISGDVTAVLRAFQEIGKLDVLSRPHILTSDNQTATITVGQEVPFIRNTRTTETGQTINTIEYEDIGIILEVTPHINPEGLVIMDVYPEISQTTAETVPISETVDAAVFAKRSAQTRIAILDEQTIVIGGLMEDRINSKVTKVPILGSIPLLGALFRRTDEETEKTELLIFLTPHVATEATQLQGMSDDEMSGAKIVPRAVAPGMFEEHMEGMRRGGKTPSQVETVR
jgi:general secretion pathway protein D